jgi:hypothetical protein
MRVTLLPILCLLGWVKASELTGTVSTVIHNNNKVFYIFGEISVIWLQIFTACNYYDKVFLLIRGTDPDPSIIKQNSRKNLDYHCFVTFLGLFIFEKYVNALQKIIAVSKKL